MKSGPFLLDTHALLFWVLKENVSPRFISFFDGAEQRGQLLISTISFWELALLSSKEKVAIKDIRIWMNELMQNTQVILIEPSVDEMILSTMLPKHHKDPFDRLLIIQANHHQAQFVSRDTFIRKYDCATFWVE